MFPTTGIPPVIIHVNWVNWIVHLLNNPAIGNPPLDGNQGAPIGRWHWPPRCRAGPPVAPCQVW